MAVMMNTRNADIGLFTERSNIDETKNMIICNYNIQPGYAKVSNPLYQSPGAPLFWEMPRNPQGC